MGTKAINTTSERRRLQHGGALPLALFMTLILALIGGITSKISQMNVRRIKVSEATQDTFQISEGASHSLFSQMAASPELWRELNPLGTSPLNYTEYSPSSYTSTNGIPTCSGKACHRNYYPIGGGLVKNFGPLSSEGSSVDALYSIADQFDENDPPTADVVLNARSGWVQVERLDEVNISADSLGGGLENNRSGGSRTGVVRFRVTSISTRPVRSRIGRSTLVTIVQVPTT